MPYMFCKEVSEIVVGPAFLLTNPFFFPIKEEISLARREEYYKEYGGLEILITKNKNKQKKTSKEQSFLISAYLRGKPLQKDHVLCTK